MSSLRYVVRCVAVEYSVQQFIYRFMAQILSMAQIMSSTGIAAAEVSNHLDLFTRLLRFRFFFLYSVSEDEEL